MEKILEEIKKEREKQNEKWGEQNHSPMEWIAILTEEVGEAAKEALDFHFCNPMKGVNGDTFPAKDGHQLDRLEAYRKELIQIAAVAVQMVECFDRHEPEYRVLNF